MKLNLGCGGDIRHEEGWVNMDCRPLDGVDYVIDLESENLPYASGSISHVELKDFLEHISRFRRETLMQNIYDILKPWGTIFVQVPHMKVLAERYLDVMKNPSPLQHPLDAETFASCMFGGQEYKGNFHKWGYDEESLRKFISKFGFQVIDIGSDGGSNMLCRAKKTPEDAHVFMAVGGGLGDVIQVYLSSPATYHHLPEVLWPNDEFPCTDSVTALWFRRITDFKVQYPKTKLTLFVQSHNGATADLFKHHRCFDEVITVKWGEQRNWDYAQDGIEPIKTSFDYRRFVPSIPLVQLSDDEEELVDSIASRNDFVVLHPFAGPVEREHIPVCVYEEIAARIADKKMNVVVVGADYGGRKAIFSNTCHGVLSLVNAVSVRVSVELILRCWGFVGTHSSMILPAWYAGVKTACIVPPLHDAKQPWEEFFNSKNPSAWGANKPFNKTFMVKDESELNIEEVVKWVTE